MVGGVYLGSTYLGIDMKTMAVGVLAKADVVGPEFFQANEDANQNIETSNDLLSAEASIAVGETAPQPKQELAESANIVEQVVEQSTINEESSPKSAPQLTDSERRAATRNYWDSLTECMLRESKNRSQGFRSAEEWQLYDYLTSRRNGHSQALETLKQLEDLGVDERLLAHGRQVITWNQSAVKLFDRALALLTDGPSAGISGPFAQSWQSSATQLRMEESLIVEKHAAIASYLDHEYPDIAPFAPAYTK